MNDADMMNQSGYRRAFRYLKSTVQQSASSARFSESASVDKDLEAVNQLSTHAIEVVFFPSYARRTREQVSESTINIHGWVFSPVPAGRQSRRNRYTMLLARSIAGLPAMPDISRSESTPNATQFSGKVDSRPSTADSKSSFDVTERKRSSTIDSYLSNGECSEGTEHLEISDVSAPSTPAATPIKASSFPFMTNLSQDSIGSSSSNLPTSSSMARQRSSDGYASKFARHYSDHDLINCHANLTTRISPFLSKPVIGQSVKVEILADRVLVASCELQTSDNGHFRGSIKVPTTKMKLDGIKRLEAQIVDPRFSATTDIHVVKDLGVSVISDMDDTVKHTNIVAGMREAFRNAFVRDLHTLEISGVRQWYQSMERMGCKIHYVSNAPYQLWPCLATFVKIAGLPSGSIHLKQYSGFLQGMFEPAAEKKRANVEKILLDFPDRKFLLIGDSGEQDLELYTELARSTFSKQILGIFIRDVTSSIDSSVTTPTGETGEDFFSAGKGDNVVDSAPVSNMLDTVTEVLSPPPPRLPQRPQETPLLDLDFGKSQGRDESGKAISASSKYLQDMIGAFSSESEISETRSDEVSKKTTKANSADAERSPNKFRPSLPRKPTALKFWSKTEDSVPDPTSEMSAEPSGKTEPSQVSKAEAKKNSGTVTTATPVRRPTLPRTLSGSSSFYGEGRKLTKAQERTHAWELRLARARAVVPKSIKIYAWREGTDCQHHAEELIQKALKR